jgi:zinc protease
VEESLAREKALTLDQVRKLYAEQVGPGAGELAIVGDFDPDAAVREVEGFLKDWKSATPYKRIANPDPADVAGSRETIETPDKANAVFVAGMLLALRDSDPDYAAVKMASYLLGEAPLSSRISVRVRGKEGLSYGAGSQMNAGALDRVGVFLVFAICNPVNIEKVDQAVAEELEKMLKEGVSEKELEEGKKAYLQQRKVQRAADGTLVGQLASALYAGRTFTYDLELEKRIAGLTVEQVNGAFRKYVQPKKLVIVRAGDFKKATGGTPK